MFSSTIICMMPSLVHIGAPAGKWNVICNPSFAVHNLVSVLGLTIISLPLGHEFSCITRRACNGPKRQLEHCNVMQPSTSCNRFFGGEVFLQKQGICIGSCAAPIPRNFLFSSLQQNHS